MSLKRISLRDFVIVREIELELSSGFTVLTGETGAGKSILVDALQLALGARADAGAVRVLGIGALDLHAVLGQLLAERVEVLHVEADMVEHMALGRHLRQDRKSTRLNSSHT